MLELVMKDNFSRKFYINKGTYSCLNKVVTKLLAIWNCLTVYFNRFLI